MQIEAFRIMFSFLSPAGISSSLHSHNCIELFDPAGLRREHPGGPGRPSPKLMETLKQNASAVRRKHIRLTGASSFLSLSMTGILIFTGSAAAQNDNSRTNNSKEGSDKILLAPQTQALQAPELPTRICPPPAKPSLRPDQQAVITAKPSLSWRQKALKLSAEKFGSSREEKPESLLLRSFPAGYADTLKALAESCLNSSLRLACLNSSAGELLACSMDGQTRLVFSIWEKPGGTTWVNAGIDRGSSTAATKTAATILDTTANTISKRGRI